MKPKLFTRNFTFLILGQISSLIGNYTLKFALSMYVLEQTGSASIFAGLLALALLPTILLSPFGGILADRANRRNIMVALDTLSGLSVLIASFAMALGQDIFVIGALLIILSVLGAFESPTVQACVPQMLSGDNIVKGNAVVNRVASIASLITPFLGSVFYTAFGIRPVFYAAVVCFFVTALLECFIRLDYKKPEQKMGIGAIIKEDFSISIHFLRREQPGIMKLLLLAASVSLFVAGTYRVGTFRYPLWYCGKCNGCCVYFGKSVRRGISEKAAGAPSCHRFSILWDLPHSVRYCFPAAGKCFYPLSNFAHHVLRLPAWM